MSIGEDIEKKTKRKIRILVRRSQHGFKKQRGTQGLMFKNKTTFDMVTREDVSDTLEKRGVNRDIIEILKLLQKNKRYKVRTNKKSLKKEL